MGRYRLAVRKSVAKDLDDLPKKDIARIIECLEALANDPRAPGGEKLSGQERYRLRQGACRIVHEIEDDMLTVVVVKIG